MQKWIDIVGKQFKVASLPSYLDTIKVMAWHPTFVVLHNTDVPNLSQRPQGFTAQHMQNLVTYYRDQCHWHAGPHFFVDDNGIWAFTPLNYAGDHSPSWNQSAIGVEMLGDYDHDSFTVGRGEDVHINAINLLAQLCVKFKMNPADIKLHKEDPKTTHKNCPGQHVDKATVIQEVTVLRDAFERR